jgi:hypothetical protein
LAVVVVCAVVPVVAAEVVVWLFDVVLVDPVEWAVVGTVAAGVEVVVLAASAMVVVSLEMTEAGGCKTLRVPPLGGAGKNAIVTSQLLRNKVPWLQSGMHVLSELFLVWRTPSEAGSWGEDQVIT